ncbi:MAG: hypothetical protein Q4A26_03520 [Candidatus Saccharibacteria bacterium]|nr:hypothetical protein [Candidatus Saccharibacteria bacterium]
MAGFMLEKEIKNTKIEKAVEPKKDTPTPNKNINHPKAMGGF